jgi:hypothetical protein
MKISLPLLREGDKGGGFPQIIKARWYLRYRNGKKSDVFMPVYG